MSRSHDAAFFKCPICGKQPYVHIFDPTVAMAYCKGYGFRRHKEVSVSAHERPSKLLKKLSSRWNQMHYEQARFLFDMNGNPFKEIENG